MKVDDFIDIYEDEYFEGDVFGSFVYSRETVKKMLVELLDLATRKARTVKVSNSGSWLDAGVDRESILNVLEL